MIYWDLDGVLRSLGTVVLGHETDDWNKKVNGKTFFEIVEDDKTVLYRAPEMCYLPLVLSVCPEIHILSSQLSGDWHTFTDIWIKEHISKYIDTTVTYVSKPIEKMDFLKNGDIIVEDYPFFDDYSKIVLIDHPYNRILPNAKTHPITRITTNEDMIRFLRKLY